MRTFTLTMLVVAFAASPAAAQDHPLAGEGENLQIVANHPVASGVTEMELSGDHAYVVHDGGMSIINIKDPAKPVQEGLWECQSGWGDVEVDPKNEFAILANAYGGDCGEAGSSLMILDIRDKSRPRSITGLTLQPSAHTIVLDGRTMYINTGVWAGNPDTSPTLEIYDISDLASPKLLSSMPFSGVDTPHDAYVTLRPDGKRLFYSGSGHDHHVIDVTDPKAPNLLQTVYTPDIEYAHQDEPTWDGKMIVSSDESLVGLFGGVCGTVVGAIHFYAAADDGTWAAGGAQRLGFWNIGPRAGQGGCSAHVYWQAPNENRLTMGMYTAGTTVLDYTDPLRPTQLGWFDAEGDDSVWGAKAHNGYVFTSGSRGLDILRYTGEGGQRWPATAGPAEVQRAARQGITLTPAPGSGPPPVGTAPDSRRIGRFSATARLKRVPGRRGRKAKLSFVVSDPAGKVLERVRLRKPAGKRAVVRATGAAVAGDYRWAVRAGSRTLARGRTRVTEKAGMVLAPSRVVEVRAR